MEELCERIGLKVACVNYDSHAGIFSVSEGLMNSNKSHAEIMNDDIPKKFKRIAIQSNKEKKEIRQFLC